MYQLFLFLSMLWVSNTGWAKLGSYSGFDLAHSYICGQLRVAKRLCLRGLSGSWLGNLYCLILQ